VKSSPLQKKEAIKNIGYKISSQILQSIGTISIGIIGNSIFNLSILLSLVSIEQKHNKG